MNTTQSLIIIKPSSHSSQILLVFCLPGQANFYNCSLCSERFSISVALLMHKVECHSLVTNDKPAILFLEELIKVETKYLSDENFDYTFIITTTVTQTAKQIKEEQYSFSDIKPDEVDLIQV